MKVHGKLLTTALDKSLALIQNDLSIDLQGSVGKDDINVTRCKDLSTDCVITSDTVVGETELSQIFQICGIGAAEGIEPNGKFSQIIGGTVIEGT